MKILHLISSGGMYGAEAVILNLCQALDAAGHTAALAAFSNADLTIYERARAKGIEAHTVPCRGPLDRGLPAALRSLVERSGADVVHTHNYKPDVYAALSLANRVPLVATCHNWIDDTFAVRVYGVLDRRALRRFGRVVAVSAEVEARLLASGIPARKVRRIRNGIVTEPFVSAGLRRRGAGFLRVGLVARLTPEKGADVFLAAAARVLDRLSDTRFVVFGEGPERSALESQAAALGLGDRLSLPGSRTDMPAAYEELDLLVSASRIEGLPMALLEGMASGLPVAATAVGDVPTVVLEGQTGLLAPAEDPDKLADAIVTLLEDDALRRDCGRAAQALVCGQYSAGRTIREYLDVYREAVDVFEEGRRA